MATIRYWDSTGSTALANSIFEYTTSTTTATGTTCITHWAPYPRVVHKKIVVPEPDHWNAKVGNSFVQLVNQEIHTGWKVTMRISGNIVICDPYIDVRTMAEFVPLLKASASLDDCKKIDDFFKSHGLTEKPKKHRAKKKLVK